jgi:exosortase A-associated hydrolase 2
VTTGGVHAEFIGEPGRRLFALLRTPDTIGGECTLVVPPFAEEMNKSRKLVTDFARHEQRKDRGVLCVDLSGTGDSEGEFETARVERWIEDLATASAWSAAEGWRVTSVLGIRLGAILAATLVRQRILDLQRAVFWQPVTSGARLIDQFLRVRVMSMRMEQDRSETVAELRARLKAGETVEVAGYALSSALCAGIDALDLAGAVAQPFPPVRWLDVVADAAASVPPGTQRAIDNLRASGCEVEHLQVVGEPYWMATEIVTNPALVAAS